MGHRLGLVLRLGVNQKIVHEKDSPPVRVRVWVRVSFGLGAIFLGGNCPRPKCCISNMEKVDLEELY